MNEEFVTEALRNDRCIKAHKLLSRFEKELKSELKRVGGAMVDGNPQLFSPDVDVGSGFKPGWDSGTIVANVRDNITMERVNPDDPGRRLRLNVSVRWVDPLDWGEEEDEGALCAACYKINRGARDVFVQVQEETEKGDWKLSIGEDQYNNAPGIFYVPVETAEDIRSANDTLIAHFTEFGDYWGVDPSELAPKD